MRNQEWNSSLAELDSLNFAQLVFCLFCRNAVDCEAAFGVVDETELLVRLLDGDYIHETSGVCAVRADLAVDFDESLHDNLLDLTRVERILQSSEVLVMTLVTRLSNASC